MKTITAERILRTLEREGLCTEQNAVTAIINPKERIWYLEAVFALAAFISAFFFMGFVSIFGASIDNDFYWVLQGIAFLAFSLLVQRSQIHQFGTYLALSFNLGGLGMVLLGIGLVTQSHGTVVLLNVPLCLFLFLTPDKLFRFLWFLIVFGNGITWLYLEGGTFGMPVFALVSMLGALYLFDRFPAHDVPRTLAYALSYAALASAAFSLSQYPSWLEGSAWMWGITKFGTALIMATYICWLQRKRGISIGLIGAIGSIAIVAWFTTPILLVALGLLVVSYATRESWLFGLAATAFGTALWFYYYQMEETLLVKSGYLVAVGTTLLVLRFLLKYLQQLEIKEVAHEV